MVRQMRKPSAKKSVETRYSAHRLERSIRTIRLTTALSSWDDLKRSSVVLFLRASRPDDKRQDVVSVSEVEIVNGGAALARALNQLAPAFWCVVIEIRHRRHHRMLLCDLADRRCGVEVRINRHQFVVIVLVWVFVVRRPVWIARVVHAGAQILVIEICVLVIEAEGVADLLTTHEVSPSRRVVSRGIEIRVVQLHRALRDVSAATDPYLCHAKPSRIAIVRVTDLHAPAGRPAISRFGRARDDSRV